MPSDQRRNVSPRYAGKCSVGVESERGRDVRPLQPSAWKLVEQLASKQKGIVTRRELLALGIGRHRIDRWLKLGFLHPLFRGVYAVGHLALARWARELGAVLACGPGAIISHWSAACAWGLTQEAPDEIHVTLTGRRSRPRAGIKLHLAPGLSRSEVRKCHDLAVTSPARTITDLAGASATELERLIAAARIKRLIKPGELERTLERSSGRPGTKRLRAVLRAEAEPGITRSEAERILRRALRAAGLPQPMTNVKVGRYEVDFLWPEHNVALELDSWQFHSHRRAFEADRRKGLALQAEGLDLVRVSALLIRDEPLLVIAHIARALERAGGEGGRGLG